MLTSHSSPYRNAMEPLAIEQIEAKIRELPPEEISRLDVGEAIAYTLNRLPPLYSTTQEGYDWQQQRARKSLGELISEAADWGIRAALRKSARFFSTPLAKSGDRRSVTSLAS